MQTRVNTSHIHWHTHTNIKKIGKKKKRPQPYLTSLWVAKRSQCLFYQFAQRFSQNLGLFQLSIALTMHFLILLCLYTFILTKKSYIFHGRNRCTMYAQRRTPGKEHVVAVCGNATKFCFRLRPRVVFQAQGCNECFQTLVIIEFNIEWLECNLLNVVYKYLFYSSNNIHIY